MLKKSVITVLALCMIATIAPAYDTVRRSIIETAKQYQGVSYRYGSESPKAFDCSGFVRYVYRTAAGIDIPRSSRSIWDQGRLIEMTKAQPGDIVVFAGRRGRAVDHVAILLDDRSIIHAVSQGPKTGVIISPLTDRYFGPRILGARTFIISIERMEKIETVEAPKTPETMEAGNGAEAAGS
ncbi:MAG: C40 family peptidase [Spirochaetaceae bacterium]|jgi:cell wall-associated NlpC family hydrolase|nr:C40 family peptidase [Spirochaetaceae bacterium]